jgi:hypothetical protein
MALRDTARSMKADETANRNGATNKNAQQQQEGSLEEILSGRKASGSKTLSKVSFGARVHDMKLQFESACRLLHVAQYDLGFGSFASVWRCPLLADAGLRSLLHGYPMDNAERQRKK